MISEKTVELNLTAEFMNWMWKIHGTTYTAIAPSQRLEAILGYDVSIRTSGFGFFIQYKRAHQSGSDYSYQLNRTKARDQHKKLCDLERTGVPVFYALPLFTTVSEVIKHRRSLLLHALWLRPSVIPVPGGGIGHHEVHYDATTKRYWVTSEDEVPFVPDESGIKVFNKILELHSSVDNIYEAELAFNQIFIGIQGDMPLTEHTEDKLDTEALSGISLMATIRE